MSETINIPKGVDTGVNLRVSKKGHSGVGGQAGDLMVQIKVKPHPYFKRDGSDILSTQYVNISTVSKIAQFFIFFCRLFSAAK